MTSDVEGMPPARRDYISGLKDAILSLHGCESEYTGSQEVIETFQGKTVWSGNVEIFNVSGHPKAKRAYAWSHATGKDDRDIRYVVVLELPPVDSPQRAVQAAVAAEIQHEREKTKGR